ncbi:MAG: DNA polymerase I [Clostridia bacterium]|nr:DNA polymerase I [Clostridia bacterium]
MDKLLLIDGNSIANRAFYALPFLSNQKGQPSGAVFGFANIIIKLLQEEKPTHVVVAFDHARKTFRNQMYSEYKMQRKPTPEELIVQFPVIKEMLQTMGIFCVEQEGIEADDIIGTISKNFNGEKYILSGDRDLFQLIDDTTTVLFTKKGVSDLDRVNESRLNEIFGIKPNQIPDLKGLMGDASDNIPGVKGVGEKTAISLLENYQNIENLYKNMENIGGKLKEKLQNDKDSAFLSKQLATIARDCDVKCEDNNLKFAMPFNENVYQFFKEWNFSSLLKNTNLFASITDVKKVKKIEEKLTREILSQMAQNIDNVFCYDLLNCKFLYKNVIYYLETNYSLFDNGLSFDEVVFALKNVFENPEILKISCNVKNDMHLLKNQGIKLCNFFDLSLANYLVKAGIKSGEEEISLYDYQNQMKELTAEIEKNELGFVYENIEKPLTTLLFEMEDAGFKINEAKLDEIACEFKEKLQQLTKQIYFEAGEEFNINSPKQVAYILFEKLGITAYNNKKQSTAATVLEELAHIPIVENILLYRKYSKLVNTYIDVYKNLCQNKGDIIHTTFNQTLTSTGRLSSSEPNLQNIPTRKDEGRTLRKIFISKFEGGKILSADYNQIELRLLAEMSGEEKLIEAYNNGEDIHSLTASQIFGVPLKEVTPEQRRDAKAVNFGIIYGISDYGLSQNIKSTRNMAKEYIQSYFNRYPAVKKFMDKNIADATEKGYAITKFGRKRVIPELASSKYITRTFGERVAMNMPLQGTASDIIKLAMIEVAKALKEGNFKSQLILQIHDELIIDVYPGEEKEVKSLLKAQMEGVVSGRVPLIVSIGEGESLYDCK